MKTNELSKESLNIIKSLITIVLVITIYYYCIKPFITMCSLSLKEDTSNSMFCNFINKII
jgi:hypothetical protein